MTDNKQTIAEIPEIIASRLRVNSESDCVILEFLDEMNEEKNDGRVAAKITIQNENYLNFILSFLEMGAGAQKDLGIDLGITVPENSSEG